MLVGAEEGSDGRGTAPFLGPGLDMAGEPLLVGSPLVAELEIPKLLHELVYPLLLGHDGDLALFMFGQALEALVHFLARLLYVLLVLQLFLLEDIFQMHNFIFLMFCLLLQQLILVPKRLYFLLLLHSVLTHILIHALDFLKVLQVEVFEVRRVLVVGRV